MALMAAPGSALAAAPGEIPKPPGANPGDRGWEKVTPADKGGVDVGGVSYASNARAAASGGGLLHAALGAFAGNPAGGFPSFYLSRRDGEGWATKGVSPPGSATVVGWGGVQSAARTPRLLSVDDDLTWAVAETNGALAPGTIPLVPNLFTSNLLDGSYRLRTPAGPSYLESLFGSLMGRHVAPGFEAVSTDGSHLLFTSAWGYTPDAPSDMAGDRLFLQSDSGAIRLVSVLPDGTPAIHAELGSGPHSAHHAVSDDGQRIYFSASGDSLYQPRTNGDLYLRDGDETKHVASRATFYAATPDGSKMVYAYTQGAPTTGVYLYNAASDTSELISVDSEPADGADSARQVIVAASEDLSRIYFVDGNALVAGQEPTGHGLGIYLWESGALRHVGTLAEGSELPAAAGPGDSPYDAPPNRQAWISRGYVSWSPDGGTLVFATRLIAGGDTGGFTQVYRYDADDDELSCISCPENGAATADARLFFANQFYVSAIAPYSTPLGGRNSVSDDGGRVFFATGQALVPEDVNNRRDVYVWDDGNVSLVSAGVGDFDSDFIDASADGDDVYFATRNRLVAADTDDLADVYDARVGGGFPEPSYRDVCAGDGCQGAPLPAPGVRGRGSAGLRGASDAAPGARVALSVAGLSAAQRSALAAGRRVRILLTVTRPGTVRLSVRARMGGRSRIVAAGRATASRAGAVSVGVRLSRAARRQLRRSGRLALSIDARMGSVRSGPVGLRLKLTKTDGR